MNPSEYVKALRLGKELQKENKTDAAIAEFRRAETLEKRPTLAHYYTGNAHF